MYNKMETVVFLIEKFDMDPAAEDEYGRNAFLQACHRGNIKMVKYLAERYPQLINSVDSHNVGGLNLAARWDGETDTVEYLIEELEMNPVVVDTFGRNALLWVCDRGNIEMIKYFARKYPQLINSVDIWNDTGLHLAARSGKIDALVLLIDEFGIDPAVEGNYGDNAFIRACNHGNINIVKYLAEKYPKLINSVDEEKNNGLILAAMRDRMEMVLYLIEQLEMDPAVEDQFGRNAFMYACHFGNLDMVKYLAEKYPNLINGVDINNDNGLHLAARKGEMDIVVYLIEELEMDPAVKNKIGQNVIFLARHGKFIEIVEYLTEKYPKLMKISYSL